MRSDYRPDPNAKRTQELGMPFGTACNRLRSAIMFHLVERLGENTCYRCGGVIHSREEMSIEHKVSWQGVSPDLFWDISNIAFSHRRCNVPHTDPRRARTRNAPDGQNWCYGCQANLPIERFWKKAEQWNGIDKYCVDCRKKKRHHHSVPSGYRGVSWDTSRGVWRVRISANKQCRTAHVDDVVAGALLYDEWARELDRPRAHLNFPREDE